MACEFLLFLMFPSDICHLYCTKQH